MDSYHVNAGEIKSSINNGLGIVTFHWSEGNTIGGNAGTSSVSFSVELTDKEKKLIRGPFSTYSWVSNYAFSISGSFVYSENQIEHIVYIVGVEISIPEEYRNTPPKDSSKL